MNHRLKFILNFLILIFVYHSESAEDVSHNSVKKELIASSSPPSPEALKEKFSLAANNESSKDALSPVLQDITKDKSSTIAVRTISPADQNLDLPESTISLYYLFMGLGALAVALIVYKAYQLRKSRAERRYGVLGDRSGQELTPLGIVDDDSENDHTVFEINRQS